MKPLFKPNYHQLGEWGIRVVGKSKISYPNNFDELANTALLFIAKQDNYDAGTSPLDPYLTIKSIDIIADKTAIEQAIVHNENGISKAQEAENATELRNNIWLPILEHIKGIGSYLKNLYNDNPRNLGLWGFTVDESTAKPKLVTTKIKLADKITLKGVLIGSTLTNIGTVDIHIYKGSTTTGNPVIVHPNEQYGIHKGFNTITISNPSELVTAVLTTMRSQ